MNHIIPRRGRGIGGVTIRSAVIIAILSMAVPATGVVVLAQTPTAKVSGNAFDQVGGLLPYVAVTLTHRASMAHHEVRTDQVGHFEIEGLAAGNYVLEAERSGFAKLQESVTLAAGEHLQQEITLQIGAFEERIAVTDKDAPSSVDVRDDGGNQRGAEKCEVSAVGGDLRPPIKTRVVRPEYPSRLREAGIKGSVVLTGRLAVEGVLKDVRIQSATHGDLAAASVAAINQWRWTPPHLNCVPIEASLTVTVSFNERP